MATSSRLVLVAVMAASVLLGMASAATYKVGEPGGSGDPRTTLTCIPGHCAYDIQIDAAPSPLSPAGAPAASSPGSPPPAPVSAATKPTSFGVLAAIMIASGLMAY